MDDWLAKTTAIEDRINQIIEQNRVEHDEMKAQLADLRRYDAVQNEKFNTLIEKVDTLIEKITALEAKPAKKWETFVTDVFKLAVAAVIGLLFGKLGLSGG